MTAVIATEDILRFYIAMGDAVFMTVLDCGKHLQEGIADLGFLRAVVIGSNSGEEIATAVEVEDEEISGEAAMDTVVTKADVGVEGNRMGNIFVVLDVLLHVELLCRTVGRLMNPGDHLDRDLPMALRVFSRIDGS